MVHRVQYLCNQCKKSQIIQFTNEMREMYITQAPTGLSKYSHIHVCENGMAGVNNLFLDHNLDVRSYGFIEIPQYKRKVKVMIPNAPKIKKLRETVEVTHILYKNDLNLLIQFDLSEFEVQIGPYNHSNSAPLHTLTSVAGLVSMHYYESDIKFTPQLQLWLNSLLKNLEILIPGKLGILIEILQFIINDKDNYPSDLDKNIIKTILVSHDIFFEFNIRVDIDHLSHAYGKENGLLMSKIMDILESNPMTNLHELVLKFKKNVVTIMFALLILELHGIITINRPDIMYSDFDMSSLLSL